MTKLQNIFTLCLIFSLAACTLSPVPLKHEAPSIKRADIMPANYVPEKVAQTPAKPEMVHFPSMVTTTELESPTEEKLSDVEQALKEAG